MSSKQLDRILLMLPYLSKREFGTDKVLKSLGIDSFANLVSEVKRVTDLKGVESQFAESVQVLVQKEGVEVFYSHFRRPMRLTVPELHALELGLNILKSECTLDQHTVIDKAVERLGEIRVREAARENPMHATFSGEASSEVLSSVREARKKLKKLEIEYISRSSGHGRRLIAPYGALFSQGRWYVIAFCYRTESRKLFRADRITSVEFTDEGFSIPPNFSIEELNQEHKALLGEPSSVMRVRYSPVVARWIAEREGVSLNDDGSLEFEHPVYDIGWAVSHVLQYGPEAEVLEPPEIRSLIRKTLLGMVADESR